MSAEVHVLSGWGRTAPSAARVVATAGDAAVADAVVGADLARGVLARGLGRSYGDAAQNGGGTVLDMVAGGAAPQQLTVTPDGTVAAPAGTSLDAVMRAALAAGWFVPVTPGTRHVTLGGAVAADIHGKNHHGDGSFGRHVLQARLVDGHGSRRVLAPDGDDPEAFWATVGGMGLTGALTDVTLRLRPVETSRMLVDTDRLADLDAVMAAMIDADASHPYSVAWIDLLARGRHLGRGVLTAGDHAPLAALRGATTEPLAFDPFGGVAAPPWAPGGLLNPVTVRAFNEMIFRRAPRRRRAQVQTIGAFFHPLDVVRGWNRLYGARGFVQHQSLVPFGAEGALRRIVERLASASAVSFLAVLKRFGAASPAPLSFPAPGWTLALDLPARGAGLAALLDEIDHTVVDAGGRIYFAKDARVDPGLVRAMYPRLDEWRAVRDRLDPAHRWQSDLSRRLGLCADDRPRAAR